MALGLL